MVTLLHVCFLHYSPSTSSCTCEWNVSLPFHWKWTMRVPHWHTHCPLPALFSTALRQPLYLLQTARNKRIINEGCISRYSELWLWETASIFAIEGNINHTQTDNGQWSSQKYFSSVSCRRWKQCPRVCIKWAVTRGCAGARALTPREKRNKTEKQTPVKEWTSLLIIIIMAPFFLSQLQLNRLGLITDYGLNRVTLPFLSPFSTQSLSWLTFSARLHTKGTTCAL